MNTPTDLRAIMFATVPVYGYANFNIVTPVARGLVWLYRRIVHGQRPAIHRAAENVAA